MFTRPSTTLLALALLAGCSGETGDPSADPLGDVALADATTLYCFWNRRCQASPDGEDDSIGADQSCLRYATTFFEKDRLNGLGAAALEAKRCMDSASSCAELRGCLDPDETCRDRAWCEGETRVTCDGIGLRQTIDCARYDSTCGPGRNEDDIRCVPDDDDLHVQRCAGDVAYMHFIRDGTGDYELRRLDCGAAGLRCEPEPGCVGDPGPPCVGDDGALLDGKICVGSHIARCMGGVALYDVDCAALAPGSTCLEPGPGESPECGLPPEDALCELSEFGTAEPACEGDTMVQCAEGVPIEFDCGRVDGTCRASGANATCTPSDTP